MNARAGNDLVRAGAGDDRVQGDNGSDTCSAGRARPHPCGERRRRRVGRVEGATRRSAAPPATSSTAGRATTARTARPRRRPAVGRHGRRRPPRRSRRRHAPCAGGRRRPGRAPLRAGPRHREVRGSERATTRITGCETIVVVVTPSGDDAAAERPRRGRRVEGVSITTRLPSVHHSSSPGRRRGATLPTDGEDPDHRGRRRHRPGDGAPPPGRGVRRRRGRERRVGSRAPALRASGHLRARPHAPRPRRLEGDRAGARGGDRHADRRRLGAGDGATACTRSRSVRTTTS